MFRRVLDRGGGAHICSDHAARRGFWLLESTIFSWQPLGVGSGLWKSVLGLQNGVFLPQEGDWRMFVRKGKVVIGTSGTDPWRYDGRGRLNLRRVPLRPPVAGWNGVR